jgi:hypothetical protein
MFGYFVIPIVLFCSLLMASCINNRSMSRSSASPSNETVLATPQTRLDLKPALQRAITQFMQAEKVPTDGKTFLADLRQAGNGWLHFPRRNQ